jgi:SAM-dependent methyltransferase
MSPSDTGAHYDQLALFWQQNTHESYGVAQLERAIRFSSKQGVSLDVGCGSHGRFIDLLGRQGFRVEGLDISPNMIALARERSPRAAFYTADICEWELPKKYDLISAWDSTFHLPIEQQEPVLKKLCEGLAPQGVLLFTCGGGAAGEITGSFEGRDFGYSTLGVEEFVRLLRQFGCFCVHVEYDQHPLNHVYIIARKG